MGLVRANARALLAGVALTAIASAQVAQAQETTTANTSFMTLLERIVVGAGKEKIAIDTPQAVTVVTQGDIDVQQAVTTGELFQGVPGITVIGSDRAFGEAFNIRGIGKTESSPEAARIIVNVDGQPKFFEQYRMGSFFGDPELYKQVEVLRGPASSTLYGAGAIGGVINFTTKDASDFIKDGKTGAIKLKGTYADNGDSLMTSALLAHRINETFEVLAAGNWRTSDDFLKADGTPLEGSAFDGLSGLVKAKASFGDNNEQSLTASYQRLNNTAEQTRLAQTGKYVTDVFGFVDLDVVDQTFVLAWENPDSDNPWIDANVSLSYSDTLNQQRNHRAERDGPLSNLAPTDPNGITFADSDYQYSTLQLKADNTVEWITDDFENYFTVGLQASTQDRLVRYPGYDFEPPTHPQGTEDKLGLFVQDELTWDNLTVTAGIRGDWHTVTPFNDSFPTLDGSAFSPKLAAIYALSDNINIFGSVAHTERLPTIDELYSVAAPTLPNPPRSPLGSSGKTASLDLRKEAALSFEAGFSLTADDMVLSGDNSSLKFTAFHSKIRDMIASNTAPAYGQTAPTYYGNIDEAEISGFEIEAAYNSEAFFANLAYTHTVGTNLLTGMPLTTVPQDKFVLSGGLRNTEWNLEYGARLTIAAEGDYILPTNGMGFGADGTAEPWHTVDLFANWKPEQGPLEGTEILASVDNLFNADYRENLEYDRSKGRTFKLTLSKQFDY